MAQLAIDDRRGVGGKAHAALRVEALRRLDEPQIGDLQQVLAGVAGVGEPLEDVVQEVLVAAPMCARALCDRAAAVVRVRVLFTVVAAT